MLAICFLTVSAKSAAHKKGFVFLVYIVKWDFYYFENLKLSVVSSHFDTWINSWQCSLPWKLGRQSQSFPSSHLHIHYFVFILLRGPGIGREGAWLLVLDHSFLLKLNWCISGAGRGPGITAANQPHPSSNLYAEQWLLVHWHSEGTFLRFLSIFLWDAEP